MSGVSFAESPKPPPSIDLAAFAKRASDISVGGDITDVDELGLGIFGSSGSGSGSSKIPTPQGKQVNFSTGGSDAVMGAPPQLRIDPIADLDVMDIDAAPGIADIKIQRDVEPAPFVINAGGGSSSSTSRTFDFSGSGGSGGSSMMIGGGGGGGDTNRAAQKAEDIRKQRGLAKLRRLDAEGITGKNMTMSNSVEEIDDEVEVRTDSKNLENSMIWQRRVLLFGVKGVGALCSSDMVQKSRLPIKPKLKKWHEQVEANMEDEFDPIFEQLYDLYFKDGGSVHPLLKLAGTLGLSAVMYHLASEQAEKAGMPDLANDPEYQEFIARKFMEQRAGQRMSGSGASAASFGGPMPFGQGTTSMAAQQVPPTVRREMRGPPVQMDDVLKAFETERMMETASAMSPPPGHSAFTPAGPPPASAVGMSVLRAGVGGPSDPLVDLHGGGGGGDDTGSIGSGATERRRGRPRRAPAPVGATLDLNV